MRIRPGNERGYADHGWLRSYHSFSFANYYDPAHMGFRSLRVINEDRVQAGAGFGTHPHRDMEIISYVLEGALEHRDSMGTGSVIRPGDVQRMSAGTGVTHSEFNPSREELVHFLQIWIVPAQSGLPPSYEQRSFPREARAGMLCLIASQDGRDGSVTVHQDVNLYASVLDPAARLNFALRPGRNAWVQVARGQAEINGTHLDAGDGAALTEPGTLELATQSAGEVLLFDLA